MIGTLAAILLLLGLAYLAYAIITEIAFWVYVRRNESANRYEVTPVEFSPRRESGTAQTE